MKPRLSIKKSSLNIQYIILEMIVLTLLVAIVPVHADIQQDVSSYAFEFAEPDEICVPTSATTYVTNEEGFLWDSKVIRTPILYTCCKASVCSLILFDLNQKQTLPQSQMVELLDIYNIQKQLMNGTLSEKICPQDDSAHICQYVCVYTL